MADLQHVALTSPDISCGHCVASVKQALGAIPGIGRVEADPQTKRVDVDFDPSRVTVERIAAARDEAGSPAVS